MSKPPDKIRKGRKYAVRDGMRILRRHHGQRGKLYLDGDMIRIVPRLKTFLKSGTSCKCCGLRGRYFVKEKQRHNEENTSFTLHLYGNRDGIEILMTSDHIHPSSRGGGDGIHNRQTMCSYCNSVKSANRMPLSELRRVVEKSWGKRMRRRNRHLKALRKEHEQKTRRALVSQGAQGICQSF